MIGISKEGAFGMVRGICIQVWGGIALVALTAVTSAAQGTVSGQVTIQERPGEVTEDLANVVVFIEPVAPNPRSQVKGSAKATVALDKRQFSPRVSVVPTGSTIEFPNRDPFSHNVFSKANGGFDTGVFGRNKTKDQKFDEPGVYPLYCNVHPRMTAFVISLNTPWYTQAGSDGRFELAGVPAGDYRMTIWHDRATMETRTITVPSAGLRDVRVPLDARGYKYAQHKNKFGKDYTSSTGDRY
jgi:plastocyanin